MNLSKQCLLQLVDKKAKDSKHTNYLKCYHWHIHKLEGSYEWSLADRQDGDSPTVVPQLRETKLFQQQE